MNIHVWVPDYASAIGGIQTLSRFLVRGLRNTYPNARICVLSKNDTSYPESTNDWTTTFTPLGWWLPGLRTAAFSAELFRRAALERPDLIITTHVNFAPVAHFLWKLFRIPFVAVGHGVDVWEIPDGNVRRALRSAEPLVAVSEFTQERMAGALGISPERIRILPNTFDPEMFLPAPKPRFLLKRFGLRPDQPVVMTTAQSDGTASYKGYDQVLRALPTLRERYPDIRSVLVGRDPDRCRVDALVRELGVAENVILAGYVADHELCAHYNLCDVFAMPSKGEGFGIVFLEALACGKPVVAGNKDGSVDALLNGKLGVLIDPDNVGEIAEALIQVLARGRGSRSGGLQPPEATGKAPLLVKSAVTVPEIMFDPEALRRAVIEAYGYERFKQRLRDVLAPVLKG